MYWYYDCFANDVCVNLEWQIALVNTIKWKYAPSSCLLGHADEIYYVITVANIMNLGILSYFIYCLSNIKWGYFKPNMSRSGYLSIRICQWSGCDKTIQAIQHHMLHLKCRLIYTKCKDNQHWYKVILIILLDIMITTIYLRLKYSIFIH